MRQAFQEQLTEVNERLVQMCRKSSTSIRHATSALLDADLALAEQVLADDADIDRDRDEIDELVIQVIALQSPVATELRTVLTAMRLTADIERMGDLAVHVAKVARMRYPDRAIPESLRDTFAEMGQIAEAIGGKASEVLRSQDLTVAEQLGDDDDRMDQLHRSLFTVLFDKTAHSLDERPIETAVDIALLGRYYERFADHAVEIANNVQFQVTGEAS